MIQHELNELSTTRRDLRKFGLLVGGVCLLLAGWTLFRHKPIWPYLLTPGALLFVLGLVLPRSLLWVYRAWMAIAFTLGLIVSTIVLTLFYFLVMTPIGLLARLFGKDFLSLKMDRQSKTYWLPRERPVATAAEYEQQF